MLSPPKTYLFLLITVSIVLASPALPKRQSCNEGTQLICYGKPNGESQKIDPEDLAYVASVVRRHVRRNPTDPPYYHMPPNPNFECEEWSLGAEGTVSVAVKHTSPRLDTAVLLEDVANTIDGGENATPEQISKSLLGCGENGGQVGVLVNTSNPLYSSEAYKAKKTTTSGLIVKAYKNTA
ncbi:hypothetical protein B0T14DRAFT_536748 [Immersiella caudata]|uniref:Uncharacterized protein n=1 Tax=Immersiella caudata TaxID=314043 RepID=A0AA39WYX1_9PEZI|nr:hypothetical protein B0T14DRAFT_536748 [Immersiella caudata]